MTSTSAEPVGGTVRTDGAELYYETTGHGSPLLVIPALGAGARTYRALAAALADRYTVIGYDRRGSGNSTGRTDRDVDLAQQCRDALAVLDAAGGGTASLFAHCLSGPLGLELVARHPDRFDAFLTHEPATMSLLDDADDLHRLGLSIVDTLDREGPRAATMVWRKAVRWDFSRPLKPSYWERVDADMPYQLRHELIPICLHEPDLAAIRDGGVPVAVGSGRDSAPEPWFGRTPGGLAARLGCPVVEFPGDHFGHMYQAEAYAEVLAGALGRLRGGG